MPPRSVPQATLTTVAEFATGSFPENLAVRADGSILVTELLRHQLWYVPPPSGSPVEPVLLHTFEQGAGGIVEIEPDVFIVSTCAQYTTHESHLHRLDLRSWTPGEPLAVEPIFTFSKKARGLNGACLLAPGTMLVADCYASLIWRVDVRPGGRDPVATVWLEHESMDYFPGTMEPEQPGVNGVRYAPASDRLYFSSTAKKLFMRVAVDPLTLAPAAAPELVVAGRMGDDFCLHEEAGVAYLTTHRQDTIDRVRLEPGQNSGFTQSVAGDPPTPDLIGPSSCAWGRAPGDYGRVAYVTIDGGTASPPPEGARPAALLRVELPPDEGRSV